MGGPVPRNARGDRWTPPELPWAALFQRRCRAVREAKPGESYHGRCELQRNHAGLHALERGFVIARWSTEFTTL